MHLKQLGRISAGLSIAGCVFAAGNAIALEEPNQQSDIKTIEVSDSNASDVWRDSTLVFKPRSYYLNRDRDINQDNVGWALGGALEYKSGWWLDHVRVNATVFTSQKLIGDSDKDGTLLFKPGPESFTVLGEANVTVRFAEGHGMRIGRQRLELPYLGSHDIRMVPNTFEAIAIGKVSAKGLAYMAGYVDRIKRKNDDEFISMSEAAGVANSNDGVAFAGARYVLDQGTVIGGVYQHSFDVFDTLFTKVEHPFQLNDQLTLKSFLQYTYQQSVGDEGIGEFTTSLLAGKLELQHNQITYRAGASTTDDEFGIQKPYGNPANYLSVIVDDFDRAGEDAWLIGISYDFKRIGVGDLSAFANVTTGNTPDNGTNASPDETEYDITLDYRIKEGWADRLWLRARGAYIDQDEDQNGDDFFDFRIIANYDIDFL